MTKEQYMKLTKQELAELLARRDIIEEMRLGSGGVTVTPYEPPCYQGGPCTNPQMDCINCPRRGVTGGFSTTCSNTDGKRG